MKAFDELSRSGQIRRLRELADSALLDYDIDAPKLTLLQHWLNTTFRVDSGDERFMLRISRPDWQTIAMIRSELLWLQAIRAETNLIVPEPVLTRVGGLLTTATARGVPTPRHVVIFRWVPGRFARSQLSLRALFLVGEFMGQLHKHAQSFELPQGFTRKRWDIDGLLGSATGIDSAAARASLSPETLTVIDQTMHQVATAMQSLGEAREVFGLIHADLYEGNYLFEQDSVNAIDFDSCGWGWYVYDIAVTLSTLRRVENYPDLRSAFLGGYRRIRELAPEHEALIETFIAGRLVAHTLWLAAHQHEPSFTTRAPQTIASQIDEIRALLTPPVA